MVNSCVANDSLERNLMSLVQHTLTLSLIFSKNLRTIFLFKGEDYDMEQRIRIMRIVLCCLLGIDLSVGKELKQIKDGLMWINNRKLTP